MEKENVRTKYSAEELEEFRLLIEEKIEKAKADLLSLKNSINNEHGTNDTAPRFKMMDAGSNVRIKEENNRLAERQRKFIANLQNALLRIENGTYGICRATGKLISKERLRAVPHATLSIDAKLAQYSKRN